jgi:hypothetical protein
MTTLRMGTQDPPTRRTTRPLRKSWRAWSASVRGHQRRSSLKNKFIFF